MLHRRSCCRSGTAGFGLRSSILRALVSTLCAKIAQGQRPAPATSGNAYTPRVADGHPFEEEALGERGEVAVAVALRARIEQENLLHPLPERFKKVIVYLGQNVVETGGDEGERDDASK
jgi:hypothetical protein